MSQIKPPPPRDLPPHRLEERAQHLLAEIAAVSPRKRPIVQGRRRLLPSLGLAVAVVAALVFTASVSDRADLTDRALAAIGDQSVLHVVISQPYHVSLIAIESGEPVQRTMLTEIWFHPGRDLKKTAVRVDGVLLDEMLETRQGGFTRGGRIYTCAWIARHPVEATKAGVSCNPDGENGTTPRDVPEPAPTIEAALAGFLDHYRSALASGRAREIGDGTLDGRRVRWIRIEGERGGGSGQQDVALDPDTYEPILVRSTQMPSVSFQVEEIGTMPFEATLFDRPKRPSEPAPSSGRVAGERDATLPEAIDELGGRAAWLGREWKDLTLLAVKRQQLVTGFGPDSGRAPTRSVGVVFEYGRPGAKAALRIKQSGERPPAYRWLGPLEPTGNLMLNFGSMSLLRRDDLYVTIDIRATDISALEVARNLEIARSE